MGFNKIISSLMMIIINNEPKVQYKNIICIILFSFLKATWNVYYVHKRTTLTRHSPNPYILVIKGKDCSTNILSVNIIIIVHWIEGNTYKKQKNRDNHLCSPIQNKICKMQLCIAKIFETYFVKNFLNTCLYDNNILITYVSKL